MKRQFPRRGITVMVIVVAIAVVICMASALVTTLSRQAQFSRSMSLRQQHQYAADSAIRRAIHRVNIDSNYFGEVWNVVAGSKAGGVSSASGQIAIRIERLPDATPSSVSIRVTTYVGVNADGFPVVTRQATLSIQTATSDPTSTANVSSTSSDDCHSGSGVLRSNDVVGRFSMSSP